MSTNARAGMTPLSDQPRVFFAPVLRAEDAPTIFDPSAGFDPANQRTPWIDLGWVENVKRSATTKLDAVRTGQSGLARVQFRQQVEARISFDFREWGKLQMALAAGTQHLNVPASDGTAPANSGGKALAAVALQAGSTAQTLMLDSSLLAAFSAGDLVAVDVDYGSESGYVGSGISGACIPNAPAVQYDADYIRRVTYNVGRVAQVSAQGLQLEQPLVGGAPLPSAKVQKVVAFVDREGASFFQEWSALVVFPAKVGGTVCFYYPRLQSASSAAETVTTIAGDFETTALHAEFVALPVEDTADGEQVVCYRSYFPANAEISY